MAQINGVNSHTYKAAKEPTLAAEGDLFIYFHVLGPHTPMFDFSTKEKPDHTRVLSSLLT